MQKSTKEHDMEFLRYTAQESAHCIGRKGSKQDGVSGVLGQIPLGRQV
jgi:hypothetical protein